MKKVLRGVGVVVAQHREAAELGTKEGNFAFKTVYLERQMVHVYFTTTEMQE